MLVSWIVSAARIHTVFTLRVSRNATEPWIRPARNWPPAKFSTISVGEKLRFCNRSGPRCEMERDVQMRIRVRKNRLKIEIGSDGNIRFVTS